MALRATYPTQDEIPEAVRSLYVEREGKWCLDVEAAGGGGGGGDDVAKLTAALDKERKAKAAAEKALADTRKSLEGLDPVKAREALKTIHDLEEKNLLGEGKFEEAVAARVQRLANESKTQVDTLTKQVATLTGQLEEALIDNGIRSAASKARVRDEAVEDAVLLGKRVFRLKDGKPVPMNGEEVIYGKEANKPMTIEEWLGDRSKDRQHWFQPSNGTGADPNAAGQRTGNAVMLTREQARDPHKWRAAKEQAEKAGVPMQVQPPPAVQ